MTNDGVFASEISFLFPERGLTNNFRKKINRIIKNISGTVGVMLLKPATSNVTRVRHKMTPNNARHGNSFAVGSKSCWIDVLIFVLIRHRLSLMSW